MAWLAKLIKDRKKQSRTIWLLFFAEDPSNYSKQLKGFSLLWFSLLISSQPHSHVALSHNRLMRRLRLFRNPYQHVLNWRPDTVIDTAMCLTVHWSLLIVFQYCLRKVYMITSIFAALQNTENSPGKELDVSYNEILCPRTESAVAKLFLTHLL